MHRFFLRVLWQAHKAEPASSSSGTGESFAKRLLKDERGVIAIVYGLSLLPLVVVIALAVDFGFYILAQSQLNLAADAAAIHAVRVAQQTYLDYSSTVAQAEAAGKTAGTQWFSAQLGTLKIATVTPTVTVTYSSAPGGFSASVTYAGTVATNVGSFLLASWPIANSANAQSTNDYLEIIMMLDNSSSMEIGASYSDIELMMRITPCMAYNAWYHENTQNNSNGAWMAGNYYWGKDGAANPLGGPYFRYICSVTGYTSYDNFSPTPQLQCPVDSSQTVLTATQFSQLSFPPYITSPLTINDAGVAIGPSCSETFSPVKANGSYAQVGSSTGNQPTMGQPCAFACHSDSSAAAGKGNDNYALARSTIGTSTPITLRFDVLKQATNNILSTMQTASYVSGNLSVGIYSFNTDVTRAYPSSGEAGTDFAAAIAAVGSPPTTANGVDTGIQPDLTISSATHSDTDFYTSMTNLVQKYLTTAGTGKSAGSPLKVLILITDGYQDTNSVTSPIDVSKCNNLKSMGYTIYVVYTPYYPLMHYYYFTNNAADFTSGDVTSNLQSCASEASDYFEATDSTALTAALQSILTSAQNNSAQVAK